jgi:hypothetical protein
MSITDDITTLLNAKRDVKTMENARNLLKDSRDVIVNNNAQIQAIVDAGDFDVIPNSIKTALNAAWNAIKAVESELEAEDIVEVLADIQV